MFATLFMGIFDLQGGTLTYINCGNEPPFLMTKGGAVTALRPTGPVIGVFPWADFSVKEIALDENDAILAFTDGITDAFNEDNVSFGTERLLKYATGRTTTPTALLKNIEEQLHQFVGVADQFDDITLLAVKRGA